MVGWLVRERKKKKKGGEAHGGVCLFVWFWKKGVRNVRTKNPKGEQAQMNERMYGR